MRYLILVLLVLIALPACGEVINGDFSAGLSGWTAVHDAANYWEADWIPVTVDGEPVMLAWTHSMMRQPEWLVNSAVLAPGTYDVGAWVLQRRYYPGNAAYLGIGNQATAFPLIEDADWHYYSTRITTTGGSARIGIWTPMDWDCYFDNVTAASVPEPASLICLGCGLIGLTVRRRR